MNVVGVLAGTDEVTIRNMNESFVLPIRLSTLRRIVQYAAAHTTAYLAHYLCLIGIRSSLYVTYLILRKPIPPDNPLPRLRTKLHSF
jgi:hypothetical protein